jgi:SAM-dependent methyltransferase
MELLVAHHLAVEQARADLEICLPRRAPAFLCPLRVLWAGMVADMPAKVRKIYASGYDVADNLIATLAGAGFFLQPGARILDYGCGEGGLVYRLLELGFDAYGFDIHERANYRSPDDRRRFGFVTRGTDDTTDQRIERATFRLPFDDNAFDLIVSTSVLEHVLDLEPVLAEIARVTDRGGVTLHAFPSKSSLIEPHLYIPFATRPFFQRWGWRDLWALLGVRSEPQEIRGYGPRTVAQVSFDYCQNGIRYRSDREIIGLASRYFETVTFADEFMYPRAT